MREDPTFKKRFGISTPIRYTCNVEIDPRAKLSYERAWKKFQKESEEAGSILCGSRFNSFLQRIEKLQDDLPYTKRVEIRYIDQAIGYGVFAKEKIPPYSILNHYAGVLKRDADVSANNDSTFMFTEFEKFSIDAQKVGNWCRFMNHSAENEANVLAWEHFSKWGPRIIFTAGKKKIPKGAQLLYSYGDSYWEEGEFEKL